MRLVLASSSSQSSADAHVLCLGSQANLDVSGRLLNPTPYMLLQAVAAGCCMLMMPEFARCISIFFFFFTPVAVLLFSCIEPLSFLVVFLLSIPRQLLVIEFVAMILTQLPVHVFFLFFFLCVTISVILPWC